MMVHSGIDRKRAQAAMQAAGLDGLVLFQPEHVAWAAGVNPGVAALFRRAGAASVVIPADPALQLALVMPDLSANAVRASGFAGEVAFHRIWVDAARVGPHGPDVALETLLSGPPVPLRPSTFDAGEAFSLLAAQLRSRGLERSRLGLDLAFVPAADLSLLKSVMHHTELVDGTDAVRRLRMIKTPAEIALLGTALALSEAGLQEALAKIRSGVTPAALSAGYAAGVRAAAAKRGVTPGAVWDYISIGPEPWGAGRPAQTGDVLKFDVGVVMAGYSSDMARTVVLGQPSRAARELHAALLHGLEAGLGLLRPGVPLAEVHAVMLDTVRGLGVPGYARGHFGHGLGNDPFSEQWPFIAADSPVMAEPGMVLAVEAPFYVDGLGGVIIEEQVLVTADGLTVMSTLPRDFRSYA